MLPPPPPPFSQWCHSRVLCCCSFLRFPGGCYVEGDWLRGAFRWKSALGSWEDRPGHFNSMWGYWSTDTLGLFEYLLLAQELGASPIWVVNNGIAHYDQVGAWGGGRRHRCCPGQLLTALAPPHTAGPHARHPGVGG